MAHVTPEGFSAALDDALEPDDWPGDAFEIDEDVMARPDLDPEREPWRIRDDHAATWALRKRRHALDEIERAEKLARDQIRQIERFVEGVRAQQSRRVTLFEALLRDYYDREIFPSKSKKDGYAHKLPDGTLTSKAGSLKTEIVDAKAALAWLEANGIEECIRRRDPEPAADAIKARFAPDDVDEPGEHGGIVRADDPAAKSRRKVKPKVGQSVPGVVFVRGERVFRIEDV
jgi:hypothetical protein